MMLRIRRAQADEAQLLSSLALQSKGYWGYDANFLEACREELTLSVAYVRSHHVFAADNQGKVLGFYALGGNPPNGELEYLFVEPAVIGRGVGKRLWHHAMRTARRLGFTKLEVQSDPFAESFYSRMGARRIGSRPSASIPGRDLPLMSITVVPEQRTLSPAAGSMVGRRANGRE